MPKAQASVVQFCTHAIVTGQVPLSVFAEEAPPGQSSGLQGLAPEGETPALWRPLAASRTHHSLASANNLRPPPPPELFPGVKDPFASQNSSLALEHPHTSTPPFHTLMTANVLLISIFLKKYI